MKAHELIAKLSDLDPETEVLVDTWHGHEVKDISDVVTGICLSSGVRINDHHIVVNQDWQKPALCDGTPVALVL